MQAADRRLDHLVGCGWFWAWTPVGAGLALSMISLGPILMLPSLGVAVALASNARRRQSAFGLLAGAGAVCLFVAWVQRSGQYLDPRPWLAIGIALFIGGIVAHAIRSRRPG